MAAVAVAPTTIYFAATNNFVRYGGGVFSDATCTTININHAMVAVGYYWSGASSSSYWIIRNSWGTGWGKYIWFCILDGRSEVYGTTTMIEQTLP